MVSLIRLRVPKRRYHIPHADAFILSSLTIMPTKSPSTSTSFLCYTLLRWVYTVGGTPTSAYIYSPVLLNSLLLTFGHHFPYAICSWLRLLQRIVGDLNLCAMVWDPLSTFICSFFFFSLALQPSIGVLTGLIHIYAASISLILSPYPVSLLGFTAKVVAHKFLSVFLGT